MQKRALIVAIAFTFIMAVYTVRLLLLQLLPSSVQVASYKNVKEVNWRKSAVDQRFKSIVVDDGRGQFFDAAGLPITGETYNTLAIFPLQHIERLSEQTVKKLAQVLELNAGQLNDLFQQQYPFYVLNQDQPIKLSAAQVEAIKQLNIEGVEVVTYKNRYPHTFDLKHFIGFTSEHPEWVEMAYEKELNKLAGWDRNMQVGAMGLEKSLDRLLHGLGPTMLRYTVDGKNSELHGLGKRWQQPNNPYYPLAVMTTIDLQLQNQIENYAEQINLKQGAIVVLDASNGDIRAMVSRPKLLSRQFSSDGEQWRNHAITAYTPGSIYKIITAAAAIEYGAIKPNETFECHGEYGRYGLSCWKEGGHGVISAEEAFAQSCNVAFAKISERLTAEQFMNIADALGATHKVGWHNDQISAPFTSPLRLLQEEEAGRVFIDTVTRDGGILAQSSIGQRDVRITPLQAANMVVTLLNYGKQYETRLVKSIQYADGVPLVNFPAHPSHENNHSIRPATAQQILKYMEKVVQSGTGVKAQRSKWSLAGKSGTAQTNAATNHQWFTGYGPVEKPQYAVSVLVLDQPQQSANLATVVFTEVMNIAAKLSVEKG